MIDATARTMRAALVGLAAAIAAVLIAPSQAAAQAELPRFEQPVFNQVVDALAAGDWVGMMNTVDPSGQVPQTTRDQVSQSMGQVAPLGFQRIGVMQHATPGPALSTLALALQGGSGVVYLYAAAVQGPQGWQIAHFTFNGNLAQILPLLN